ncbi:MAG: aminotransferase class I/II-fold pyridoxal phosphate-dependent enzyme [Synergistaceae bacterium]|jgi:aspartate/methionine/tyrosine aminotransferase|nr:aminotransferase class I/II-fold pyridoxal phosphate-dependent enzyme [Synergistaceae bacterium]
MVAAFKERRDYLVEALSKIDGIHCVTLQSAFYAFPEWSASTVLSAHWEKRPLNRAWAMLEG